MIGAGLSRQPKPKIRSARDAVAQKVMEDAIHEENQENESSSYQNGVFHDPVAEEGIKRRAEKALERTVQAASELSEEDQEWLEQLEQAEELSQEEDDKLRRRAGLIAPKDNTKEDIRATLNRLGEFSDEDWAVAYGLKEPTISTVKQYNVKVSLLFNEFLAAFIRDRYDGEVSFESVAEGIDEFETVVHTILEGFRANSIR